MPKSAFRRDKAPTYPLAVLITSPGPNKVNKVLSATATRRRKDGKKSNEISWKVEKINSCNQFPRNTGDNSVHFTFVLNRHIH